MVSVNKKHVTQVVTQQGECTINLNISITIDGSDLKIGVQSMPNQTLASNTINEEKVEMEIPDFTGEKIQFGKKG